MAELAFLAPVNSAPVVAALCSVELRISHALTGTKTPT